MSRISITTEQIEYLAKIGVLQFKSDTDLTQETMPLLGKLRHARRNAKKANLIILIGMTIFVMITWVLKHPMALK